MVRLVEDKRNYHALIPSDCIAIREEGETRPTLLYFPRFAERFCLQLHCYNERNRPQVGGTAGKTPKGGLVGNGGFLLILPGAPKDFFCPSACIALPQKPY